MKAITRFVGVGGLAIAASIALAAPAQASADSRQASVFVQNDDPTGNAIIAYDRAADGTLQQVSANLTGGRGGVLGGAGVDHLSSQNSLAYDRSKQLLYAVNAGSNTVTVFAVQADRLVRRQVIDSGGNFPVSIAVHGDLVYVLNARDGGSIQGFRSINGRLEPVPAWHRSLGLDAGLTPEADHTAGDVIFAPTGGKLIVTTKASNTIDVFSIDRSGAPSARPVVTADPGDPFAGTFDSGGHLVITDVDTNVVATYTVNSDGTLTAVDRASTGQTATCWIVRSGAHLYASNTGSASLSGYHDSGDGILSGLGNTATDPGPTDAAASSDGDNVYVEANGTVDEYRINANGSLTQIGAASVPNGIGAQGIVAS